MSIKEDRISIDSDADIAAGKVNAILKGGKKDDFFDIAEILEHCSIDQIIDGHSQKFPTQMLLISIPQALTYFVDADESENPVSLRGQTWSSVKKLIQQKVKDYLK